MGRVDAHTALRVSLVACVLMGTVPTAANAQRTSGTGLEVGAIPAINFDSDEGFGYGVLADLYQYGDGTRPPYLWTVQPRVFLTTGGRRDLTLFVDAPHVILGWRLDAFVGLERRLTTPYYGLGNEARYDPGLEASSGPNPDFYGFGRTRRSLRFNLQRPVAESPLRLLVGLGTEGTTTDAVPDGIGTSLYAREVGSTNEREWTTFARGGLVWDTRDRESGPTRGAWTELLVQWSDRSLGADFDFTRWTFIDRRYTRLGASLVFAHRVLLQEARGEVPVYELNAVPTSFRQQEGLGGANTLRGVLKNRFTGRGMLVWNAELRWRVAERTLAGRSFHAVVSGFLDQGRVWSGRVRFDEVVSDLHRGFGGGLRIGMGENFVAAVDVGTSGETGVQTYVGLGYLY